MTYGRLLTLLADSLRRRTLDRKGWFRLLLEERPARLAAQHISGVARDENASRVRR
jgi:hypothetical protein